MRAWPMIARLCWKEFCQGWMLLLAGCVIPPAGIMLNGRIGVGPFPSMVALFLLLAFTAILAARLAADNRYHRSFTGVHLPLHPAAAGWVAFLLHGAIAAAAGTLFAAWSLLLQHHRIVFTGIFPAPGLLFFAVFAIAYALSAAYTAWAGMAGGVIWAFTRESIQYAELTMIGGRMIQAPMHSWSPNPLLAVLYNYWSPGVVAIIIFYVTCITAAALVVLLQQFSRPTSPLARGLLAGILLAGVIGYPTWRNLHNDQRLGAAYATAGIHSPDGSLAVEYLPQPGGEAAELRFTDYRRSLTAVHRFAEVVKPLWLDGREAVIVAREAPRGTHMTLVRWEVATGRTTELLSLATKQDALYQSGYGYAIWSGDSFFASVSPDGRYALMSLPSLLYEEWGQRDIWAFDLSRRTVSLLLPVFYSEGVKVGWRGSQAILSGVGAPLAIAFPEMTTRRLESAAVKGGD